MSRSRKATKHPRFRDIDAWDALKRCDLECAINLLISGEWIIDSIVKDGWSPLNARVGSERCHVTALLAFILRCLMIDYLRDSNLCEEFKTLIAEYCSSRTEDKQWTHVFKREDVYIENSAGYNSVLGSVIDFMGPDWTTFVASVRTITSFSILSTMECGLNIYYRRLGDVLVATSKEQQAAGMGKFHDAEFPLRTAFTEVSFNLTEKLSEQILPCDEPCWKLGGYSMYCASQSGQLLGVNNDAEYIKTLDELSFGYLISVFGFSHQEYPPQTENGGVDLLALQKSICGEIAQSFGVTLESVNLSCGLNPNNKVNNKNLLWLSVACDGIKREFDLDETFIARQRDSPTKTAYRMQCKSISFTFNHIDISTPKIEEAKWSLQFLINISPQLSPCLPISLSSGMTEADRLILVNNDNEKLKSLLQHHLEHSDFLTAEHKVKIDRHQNMTAPPLKGAKFVNLLVRLQAFSNLSTIQRKISSQPVCSLQEELPGSVPIGADSRLPSELKMQFLSAFSLLLSVASAAKISLSFTLDAGRNMSSLIVYRRNGGVLMGRCGRRINTKVPIDFSKVTVNDKGARSPYGNYIEKGSSIVPITSGNFTVGNATYAIHPNPVFAGGPSCKTDVDSVNNRISVYCTELYWDYTDIIKETINVETDCFGPFPPVRGEFEMDYYTKEEKEDYYKKSLPMPKIGRRCNVRVSLDGAGWPHQRYLFTQVSEVAECGKNQTCCTGRDRSGGFTFGMTGGVGCEFMPGATLTFGFMVQRTWTTGNSYTCQGNPGDRVCVWYKVAYTAYTVRKAIGNKYKGPLPQCLEKEALKKKREEEKERIIAAGGDRAWKDHERGRKKLEDRLKKEYKAKMKDIKEHEKIEKKRLKEQEKNEKKAAKKAKKEGN
ncbi:hypothetical protein FACUT_4355 [Fusarium acutatum]|uniref:Uncharacterized protein n=1 Tax=Fusarium acutatum TaxID=78861 RepID=A0A8H4NV18_9HYPO|nr:hypothetical protein FACUT_4355 [Fusarium acutatum]